MSKSRAISFLVSKLDSTWLVSARGVAVETYSRPQEAISSALERFFEKPEQGAEDRQEQRGEGIA